MKKILSLFISLSVAMHFVAGVYAAQPKTTFGINCNTQEKQLNLGFQSDPADPVNGPEIIALKFTYVLTPHGTSTFNDIKGANLVVNPAYSNFIVAENKKTELVNSVELKLAGGFTGGTGLPQAADIAFIQGINQKAYKIVVQLGEMYPKNNNTNIYVNSNEQFIADPATCPSSNNTSQTPNTGETTLALTSNKTIAKAGESVEITAVIKNRNGKSIDWTQTGGTPIQPSIKNEELSNNETKSVLTFTMFESAQDIILKLAVGDKSDTIEVGYDGVAPTASQTSSTTPTTTEPAAETGASASLQERLQQRREELNAGATQNAAPTATAGNVHGAADGLSKSGPEETLLLVIISALAVLSWKKLRRSQVNVDV